MPFFRDTFTASVNQNLEDHVPDVGTSWTELWATTPGTGWNVNASLDALTQDNAAAAGAIYTADGVYPSAQYGVTVTVYLLYPVYLCVRIQDAENMYAVQLAAEGGGICQLYKKVSGAWTALGSAFDPPAAGSIVRLEIVDGTLSFYDDGVLVASVYVAGSCEQMSRRDALSSCAPHVRPPSRERQSDPELPTDLVRDLVAGPASRHPGRCAADDGRGPGGSRPALQRVA